MPADFSSVTMRVMLTAGLSYLTAVLLMNYLGQTIDNATGYQPVKLNWIPGDELANKALTDMLVAQSIPVKLFQMIGEWYLIVGLSGMVLKVVSGQVPLARELFTGYRKFLKIAVANILYGVMVALGFLLLIVPGVIIAVRFSSYQFAILEKDMGILEAFSYSAKITKNSVLAIIVLSILAGILFYACGQIVPIALIAVVPFSALIQAATYHWLTRGARAAFDR